MRARTTLPPSVAAALLLAAGGCNPRTTRLPDFGPLPPIQVEGPSQERFDPFADDDLGPETNTRPPDYLNGRPDARTRPAPGPAGSQGPLTPFTGLGGRYPDVVR